MEKLKEYVTRFREWRYHRKAIKGLLKKYYLEVEVDKVLKDWISACIIERKQEGRRKELVESMAKVKEDEFFIKWLLTLK